jgi:hypothetical protein
VTSLEKKMRDITASEIEEVGGGINGGFVLVGLLAGIVGGGLTVAGLGTPISIGGAALAVEGGALLSLGLVEQS